MRRSDAPARLLLYPFSLVYRLGVSLRNWAFDRGILTSSSAEVPVIAVGNLVSGGVGKTPLVQYIAKYCAGKGRKVGIVSRGYGRRTTGLVDVADGSGKVAGPDDGGDEAVQTAAACPDAVVVVCERRVDAARRAVDLGADMVIADDAFQHRYLRRNLNILVMDGRTDLRKEPLLPAGSLREPLSGLARADVVALSHSQGRAGWFTNPKPSVVVSFRYKPLAPRPLLEGEVRRNIRDGKIFAFSGIGNHERFLETVKSAGFDIGGDLSFPDHHRYDAADFERIAARAKQCGCKSCVTTEKDAVRIGRENKDVYRFLREQEVSYIPVEIEFTGGQTEFHRAIDNCLNIQIKRQQ